MNEAKHRDAEQIAEKLVRDENLVLPIDVTGLVRSASCRSPPTHTYDKPGKYRILVKAIDIFGNDTSQAFDVEVK